MPISARKKKDRGFNQADIIARLLSKRTKASVENSILIRVRDAASQYSLTRHARMENLKDAFTIPEKAKVANAKFLLVDDVCTSGPTFVEAAKTLYRIGVKEVRC